MGQALVSEKKEQFVKALIDGDIKYINKNFKEEIQKWDFKNLYVDSQYYVSQDPHSEMPIFDSPVNILERVVYKAKHDSKRIWDMMINNGADENLIANFAQEPVTVTTQKNTWYKKSVLEAAILKNKPNLVKVLIEYGADLNYKNPRNKNKTPITLAFSKKKNDIIKIIIDKNSNGINFKNFKKETFLHIAVLYENIEIIKYLLENNANLNIKDNDDETPLFNAQYVNNAKIFNLLVEKGANLNIRNKEGQTIKQLLENEMYRLKQECKFFLSSKGIVEITIKFLKLQLEKTFNEEKQEKIEQMIEKRKMLNIIENYENDFDSDEVNSLDYRNQPSTSRYNPRSPQM